MQREFPEAPLIGVGAVILHQGKILLVKRGAEPLKGHWSLPGGLVGLGESLLDAVQREVLEETGLDVEPVALIEIVERVHRQETRVQYHYVVADYLCRVRSGEVRAASDAADVCWFARDEWHCANEPGLDAVALRVMETGWQMAQARKGEFASDEA